MSPTEDAVKAASSVDMPVLEGLRLALGSLKDPEQPFAFIDWRTCACGHIYAGANRGKLAASQEEVAFYESAPSPRSRYGRMLKAIVRANDLDTGGAPQNVVSDATLDGAKESEDEDERQRNLRAVAISLVEKAIAYVEAKQRKAMRAKAGK